MKTYLASLGWVGKKTEENFLNGLKELGRRIIRQSATDMLSMKGNLKVLANKVSNVRTSVMGIASGVYPIHLLSFQELPYDSFRETDEAFFRTIYRRTERGGHYFEIYPSNLPEVKFYFTVPEVILSKYRDSMRRFKMEFLEWIDIPITVRGMRRILRFKLDTEWLRSLR